MKNNKITKLKQAYSKKIKQINKSFFVNKEAGLVLFVDHLRYLRDCLVLTSLDSAAADNVKIATIVTAIAEFDAYKNEKEKSKKAFHWNNFCELTTLNMEEWLNDSV